MNRFDFQKIAVIRLREAKALLAAELPEGAYYLAGYAVECALKACIAKRTREHDFPEKKLVIDSHTHDLEKLMQLAKLKDKLNAVVENDQSMNERWTIVQEWSEASRYESKTLHDAARLLNAIQDQTGGLLPWLQKHR